jgi:hypothetical protein
MTFLNQPKNYRYCYDVFGNYMGVVRPDANGEYLPNCVEHEPPFSDPNLKPVYDKSRDKWVEVPREIQLPKQDPWIEFNEKIEYLVKQQSLLLDHVLDISKGQHLLMYQITEFKEQNYENFKCMTRLIEYESERSRELVYNIQEEIFTKWYNTWTIKTFFTFYDWYRTTRKKLFHKLTNFFK